MAFEADCGSSTVLEAVRVTTAVGFLAREECRAAGLRGLATRSSAPEPPPGYNAPHRSKEEAWI